LLLMALIAGPLQGAADPEAAFREAYFKESAENAPEEALALYDALAKQPNLPASIQGKTHFRRGVCEEKVGRPQEAVKAYRLALASSLTPEMRREANARLSELDRPAPVVTAPPTAAEAIEVPAAPIPRGKFEVALQGAVAWVPSKPVPGFGSGEFVPGARIAFHPTPRWSVGLQAQRFGRYDDVNEARDIRQQNFFQLLESSTRTVRQHHALYLGVDTSWAIARRGWDIVLSGGGGAASIDTDETTTVSNTVYSGTVAVASAQLRRDTVSSKATRPAVSAAVKMRLFLGTHVYFAAGFQDLVVMLPRRKIEHILLPQIEAGLRF
jgi:hypothetical protein